MQHLSHASGALLLAALLSLVGCETTAREASREPSVQPSRSRVPETREPTRSEGPDEAREPSDGPTPNPDDKESSYALGSRLPDRPAPLARALGRVHTDLADDLDRWLGDGGKLKGPLVATIRREALFQQRLYRKMAREPRVARAALRHLNDPLRARATANFEAGHGLSSGLQPLKPPIRLNTVTPESPHNLLSFYEAAQRRYGVDWAILAAINFVETRFGRILGPSTAGAIGPMQFLPSTWAQYGKGGDIRDPRDAIFGAARYLRASNVLTNPRGAVFAYNHSDAYVEAVLTYARQIRRRPGTFYEYYFWQVFVRTTNGDVQLTGPGAAQLP